MPANQHARLMEAVRALSGPYQRGPCSSRGGAGRGAVQRLDRDRLDAYPDRTPRMRITVGTRNSERLVPLHADAAADVRALKGLARDLRGFRDEQTGIASCRLFVLRANSLSAEYLFGE